MKLHADLTKDKEHLYITAIEGIRVNQSLDSNDLRELIEQLAAFYGQMRKKVSVTLPSITASGKTMGIR